MAVTLTQEDINAVAQQVLTLIRESGREFNDTPISFTDPFNVAAEERENIKVPAIDERIAGQVKTGSLDLEALLQAYGLTEVQQIASEVSSSYMKKVADSDLNMNGYAINGLGLQSGNTFAGSLGHSVLMPYMNNSAVGVAESATPETYFLAYVKKLYTQYANSGLVSFTGSISLTGYGYGEISGCVSTYASHVDSNGDPYLYSFKVVFTVGKTLYVYRVNASNSILVRMFDTNYDINGKRTADLDMGGNQILYCNGISRTASSVFGKIIPCRYYSSTEMGVEQTNIGLFPALVKQLCRDNPNTAYATYIGTCAPSTAGVFIINIYATSDVDSTGMPRYASGTYFPNDSSKIYRFGIVEFTYDHYNFTGV